MERDERTCDLFSVRFRLFALREMHYNIRDDLVIWLDCMVA